MTLPAEIVAGVVCPLTRRIDFRGKRRLRLVAPLPTSGVRVVSFPEGIRMGLDLSESLQRDFFFGLHDRFELRLVAALLADGGDVVDVGAHVGLYSVFAGSRLGQRGRVLAFEPNPTSLAQLERNVLLNALENVEAIAAAASSAPGHAELHVPAVGDAAWARLDPGAFEEGTLLAVELTTVDAEVTRRGLEPVLIKIDVEGHELEVIAGAAATLAGHPAILCEVGPDSAPVLERELGAQGYSVFAVVGDKLVPAPLPKTTGPFNAAFFPDDRRALVELLLAG